jgi:hypothetical protein
VSISSSPTTVIGTNSTKRTIRTNATAAPLLDVKGLQAAAARDFGFGDPAWRIELPARAPVEGQIDLAFTIEDPNSPVS